MSTEARASNWPVLTRYDQDHLARVALPLCGMEVAAASKPSQVFWSNGSAWGTVRQTPGDGGTAVELTVLQGTVTLRHLRLAGLGEVGWEAPQRVSRGERLVVEVTSGS